jgi:molecular chaperone DnaK
MTLALGIDLGTTNSCAAVATPTGVEFVLGPRAERIHPSVVAYPAAGGVAIGADARLLRMTDPRSTIYSAKRLIGQNIRAPLVQLAATSLPYLVEEGPNQQPIIAVRDRRLTVPEVSAQVLLHLRRCAQRQFADDPTQAVITVPANFSDAQRRATAEAGRLAGLEVLRLINEPTAAALAYGFGQRRDEVVCVFDFGGGTFDVSVLRVHGELFEVLATDGDFFLGGDDLDRALTAHLAAELARTAHVDAAAEPGLLARLAVAAEAIKQHLSAHTVAEGVIDDLATERATLSLPFRVTRGQFEGLIDGYVERTLELCRGALTAAGLDPGQVHEVLCVGGSTRIPLVRRRLAELFGREPLIRINPDEVVAHGAAIQAGSLSGRLVAGTGMATVSAARTADATAPPPRPLLLDVTPATLGIAAVGGYVEPLVERNSPVPIEQTRVFTTARDQQTAVIIECCRGEHRAFADNEPLGQLVLDGLPPRPRGEVRIAVMFRVDPDGILHVRAQDADTGMAREATLTVLGAPAGSGG